MLKHKKKLPTGLLRDSLEKGIGGLYTEMFLNFLGAGLGVSRTQQEVFSESPVKVLEVSWGACRTCRVQPPRRGARNWEAA